MDLLDRDGGVVRRTCFTDGLPLMARRAHRTEGRRRGLTRSFLAATAIVIVGAGTILGAGVAAAATRVSVEFNLYYIRGGTTIKFSDIGGNCDRDKSYPTIVVPNLSPYHSFNGGIVTTELFTASASGSCAFESSNAQYQLHFRTPSGNVSSAKINVTQKGTGFTSSWSVACYDAQNMRCGFSSISSAYDSRVKVDIPLGPINGE